MPLLRAVRAAEEARLGHLTPRGYLPIDGIAAYDAAVKGLVFGVDSEPVKSGRVATAQGIGGTGGLKIGADFLKKLSPNAKVLISDPSWENHRALFSQAGFVVESYPYYDAAKRGVNFDGMSVDGELERVRPEDIKTTAHFTIEGELDDISGSGQTEAAHGLCHNIPKAMQKHLEVKGAGHYGIFSGRRWRDIVYPQVKAFILENNRAAAQTKRAPAATKKVAKPTAKRAVSSAQA